jgi:formylglycine-generating enzyme required for sulfatase activity
LLEEIRARAPKKAQQQLIAGATKVNQKDGLSYVWIPPGRFTMGCSPGDTQCYGEKRHEVKITKGFWLGQTPVTQGAFSG